MYKLIIVIFLSLSLLAGCSESPPGTPVDLEDEATFKIKDYVIQRNVEKEIKWLLHAGSGDYYESRKTIDMKDIKVRFYDDNINIAVLTGDSGTIDTEKNDMIISGNVIYTRLKDNLIMKTEKIFWDDKNEIFYNHDEVLIKDGDREIRSIGITANRDLTEYSLENIQAEGVDKPRQNE